MEEELHTIKAGIAANDQKAFGQLFALFYKRLYRFSLSILRIPELANEVVEDVFLKLWSNRSGLSAINNLSVYLYVAVKNQSLNKLSLKANEWISSGLDEMMMNVVAVDNDPYTQMITGEMLNKVNRAIEELPPRCKMIFKLVREDGLKYKEVAAILNISVNTIDVQMATAVKRISESLGIAKNIPVHPFSKKIKKS
ncbi:RNA polymerase sigma-70 factor [Niabella ginsenosidivorans]|uniref:RNA polymerase sigma-70 factor n=1 Tax=Niabella ginsenosidivorans TaxID=1176587 RepID=A0A1A9I9L5_9BACT|nr:RNA polymerase sigma-70 factor [Niabella ginsenosidivorans]ANH83402.1 RNA polymerase sigma-70 factor [Niabella ginsenosidivorans]